MIALCLGGTTRADWPLCNGISNTFRNNCLKASCVTSFKASHVQQVQELPPMPEYRLALFSNPALIAKLILGKLGCSVVGSEEKLINCCLQTFRL